VIKNVRQSLAEIRLPLIGAPMFLVSGVELVLAQCKSGVPGCFPSLNARSTDTLDEWLGKIHCGLEEAGSSAPFGVNLICHPTNKRLEADLRSCVEYQVPLVITSLYPPSEVIQAVHAYGGLVMHDVISAKHARKAADQGVDGLILVSAGAGGHGGTLNPLAFVEEIRRWYTGLVALAGGITTGRSIAAAIAAGADFAYMGTRFIATAEAEAAKDYKDMLVQGKAEDVFYTDYFTGVMGNYLKPSVSAAGLNPDDMPPRKGDKLAVLTEGKSAWRDIWSAGQGIGSIENIPTAGNLIEQLEVEFKQATKRLMSQ
jgi:nitronate monooxygenase